MKRKYAASRGMIAALPSTTGYALLDRRPDIGGVRRTHDFVPSRWRNAIVSMIRAGDVHAAVLPSQPNRATTPMRFCRISLAFLSLKSPSVAGRRVPAAAHSPLKRAIIGISEACCGVSA